MWWFWEKPWNRCILLHVVHTIFVHLCFLSRFSYASEWKLLISVTNFDVILSSLYVTLSTQDFISIFCNFVICPVWFRIILVIFFCNVYTLWSAGVYVMSKHSWHILYMDFCVIMKTGTQIKFSLIRYYVCKSGQVVIHKEEKSYWHPTACIYFFFI